MDDLPRSAPRYNLPTTARTVPLADDRVEPRPTSTMYLANFTPRYDLPVARTVPLADNNIQPRPNSTMDLANFAPRYNLPTTVRTVPAVNTVSSVHTVRPINTGPSVHTVRSVNTVRSDNNIELRTTATRDFTDFTPHPVLPTAITVASGNNNIQPRGITTMGFPNFTPRYNLPTATTVPSDSYNEPPIDYNQPIERLLPRPRQKPLHSPPPVLPARNPARVGNRPHSMERVSELWDDQIGDYVKRQPDGEFRYTLTNPNTPELGSFKQPLRQPYSEIVENQKKKRVTFAQQQQEQQQPQRSLSTNNNPHALRRLNAATCSDLHEQINNLRQTLLNSQDDDDDVFATYHRTNINAPDNKNVFTANPNALRRTLSNTHSQTPARNFSMPTYGSPAQHSAPRAPAPRRNLTSPTYGTTPKQATPARPLRRVRSRSVNLGTVAEASELPRPPLRWGDLPMKEARKNAVEDSELERLVGVPYLEMETMSEHLRTAAAAKEAGATLKEASDAAQKASFREVKKEDEEGEEACGKCGSVRKALARNPLCCVDRKGMKRLCFKCWGDALAEGLSKEKREDWLCCAVCERELLSGDARRLASRGTKLKYRVKAVASKLQGSLPQGFGGKVMGEEK